MAKAIRTSASLTKEERYADNKQRNDARRGISSSLPSPTQTETASGGIKDLSIALANDYNNKAKAPSSGGGSIKDLSIALAGGAGITQNDILDAQKGGKSLASRVSPATSSFSIPGGVSTTASSPTSNTTSSVSGGRYNRYLDDERNDPVTEPTYEDIERNMMKDAQRSVNNLYKYERSLLAEQGQLNQENLDQTRARNVLSGLSGSSEADRTTTIAKAQNQQANEGIKAQIQVQVQNVLSQVRQDARQMYQFERQQSRLDAQTASVEEEKRYERAVTNTAMLAQTGATAEGFRQTDPEGYQYLAQTVGGEDVLKAMFTLNRPQDSILDKKIEGGKYIVAFQNPLDGSIKVETVDLGLPAQYSKTVDAGDRILAIPDDWSGDPSELITINKGLTPTQQASGTGAPSEQLYSGLSSATATAVRSKVGKFSSEPLVQNFATIQDGYNFTQSISDDTQNPADDQALIYSLAKTLDPGSVVREGEYATAQKYAQSWVQAYGKGVTQALAGTGFLSKDARQNIKKIIETKYNSSLTSYENLYNNYVGGINSLTGRSDGGQFLIDYVTGGGMGDGQVEYTPEDGLTEEDAYNLYLQQVNGAN